MIMMCLCCAGLAVWLAVPAPMARTVTGRLAQVARVSGPESLAIEERRRHRRRSSIYLAVMIILLLMIITAAGYVADAQGAVASCAISLVALTAIRLGWQYRRRRAALRFRAEIAHATAVLASLIFSRNARSL